MDKMNTVVASSKVVPSRPAEITITRNIVIARSCATYTCLCFLVTNYHRYRFYRLVQRTYLRRSTYRLGLCELDLIILFKEGDRINVEALWHELDIMLMVLRQCNIDHLISRTRALSESMESSDIKLKLKRRANVIHTCTVIGRLRKREIKFLSSSVYVHFIKFTHLADLLDSKISVKATNFFFICTFLILFLGFGVQNT